MIATGLIENRLRERRKAARITQGMVEEYDGISSSYVSNLENREAKFRPNVWETLATLARRYRTSTDYLLGLTDDPRPVSQLTENAPAYYTDDQIAMLEFFSQLDEEEREFVVGLIEFVRKRNTPRIIGEE